MLSCVSHVINEELDKVPTFCLVCHELLHVFCQKLPYHDDISNRIFRLVSWTRSTVACEETKTRCMERGRCEIRSLFVFFSKLRAFDDNPTTLHRFIST